VLISRDPSKIGRLPAGAKIVQADLQDMHSLEKAFAGVDVIINAAAEVRDASRLEKTNVQGTRNLVNAAIACGVKKIIHLSSVGVVGAQYGTKRELITEDSSCSPQNEYERTKLQSEKILLEAAGKELFRLAILRPTNVFGEYHSMNAMLSPIQHILQRRPMPYTSNAMVNYVYVKDVTGAMIRLISDKEKRGILNVGTAMPVKEFFSFIERQASVKGKWIAVPQFLVKFMELLGIRKLRPLTNANAYDDSKLKKFYSYPYGAEKGLQRTMNYYKEKGLLK
jgi:nucleoside-diphosphate-sugar epimerase